MGHADLPREVVEANRRGRLLAAAKQVFAGRGYRGTSVDDLVASAGIGVGSFYALFSGKEECFVAACRAFLDSARAEIGAAGDLGTGLRRALEIGAADPAGARLLLVEAPAAGAAGERLHAKALEEATGALGDRRTAAALAWLLRGRLVEGRGIDPEAALDEALAVTSSAHTGEA